MTSLADQYLDEMGVLVWVLRENIRPVTADSSPATQSPARGRAIPAESGEIVEPVQEAPPKQTPPKQTPPAPAAAVPRFHLCFMHGAGVSIIYSLPLDANPATQPSRRFADDVLLAVTGKPASSMHALRWPIVQSRHIDQSEAAAQVVVKQRIDQCARTLVVFGDEAARLTGDVSSRQRLDFDDIGRYLDAPLSKRELWQALMRATEGVAK